MPCMIMKDFTNYKYYNGEDRSPYRDDGKDFWWRVEKYAHDANDDKIENQLSETMCAYIRERHWQGDTANTNTTWPVALGRATEMYLKGVWEGSYLTRKKVAIQ